MSPERFHTPVHSEPHLRESPSIGSYLSFEGHISRSRGTDIHSVQSFLAGTHRLILSAAFGGIHPSPCIGMLFNLSTSIEKICLSVDHFMF